MSIGDVLSGLERKEQFMKYTLFGKTGLRISQIALGTGNFGTGWGHGADPDISKAVFNA
jgi:aryl-alcohol dehydrogenase-like predicted oxidoreductase